MNAFISPHIHYENMLQSGATGFTPLQPISWYTHSEINMYISTYSHGTA